MADTSGGTAAPRSDRPLGAPQKKPSLVKLLTDIPTLVTDLVQREIALLKTELLTKLKALGIGAGLLFGALVVVLFMIGVLLTAAVLALSLVLPGWLSALIVAAFLLIVAGILALIGWRVLKRGIPPIPSESIESLKSDVRAIRGLGKRGAA
ncbi:MAG TPA: phage holin family protein [Pseudolysinimonas sp.]|nr:phage holin family protein [Pseudolysinimonas sp.]